MSEALEPEHIVLSLAPLHSALETYAGRDEYGPIYQRLELMFEKDQVKHLPNLIRCLVSRISESEPLYTGRLAHQYIQMTSIPDAQPVTVKSAREEAADQFVQFAGTFLLNNFVGPRTGVIKPAEKNRLLGAANSRFAHDPFVNLSKEAAGVLRNDDLGTLGQYLVCGVTAVVEVLDDHRLTTMGRNPTGSTVA